LPQSAAIIDADAGAECVFGDDLTVDDIVWTGPQPLLQEKCQKAGISESAPLGQLQTVLERAANQDRQIHFLPQYRPENILKLQQLLKIHPEVLQDHVSEPLVEFRDVHRLASEVLVSGLKDLGLITGNVAEAVEAGVHTLFFQCGLGHMMGLDVHDMEGLGEDYVGYTDAIKRNPEFGWRSLRLGKALEPGFVITVEPGIYFIPQLIDRWKAEQKNAEYVNYDIVEKYKDFGGIRIEDDVLVTETGCRTLGKPIPKTINEVEDMSS